MVSIVINLNHRAGGVYLAGETISGTIQVTLLEPKKFRALSFVIHGRAKCEWTETETVTVGYGDFQSTVTNTVYYEGKNVYLHTKSLLFGRSGGEPIKLPSGTHEYNFLFPLPALIPASFEGKYGNIRYRVEAELDVPWGFDKEYKLQFTVARKEDLNFQPELKIPICNEEFKTFCCWCCQSEPLITTITIPFGGFVPGQDIPVNVNYVNNSDVDVEGTRIYLQQITRFNSSSPSYETKIESEKVAEIFYEGVLRLQNKKINAVLTIPNELPISNEMYCNVVQVSYLLRVVVITQGLHKNVKFVTPIVIGSIPLLMHPSAVQPTFTAMLPVLATQPVQTYSDVQAVSGNYQQNGDIHPLSNGHPADSSNVAPPPTFNKCYAAPHPPTMVPYDPPPTFDQSMAMNSVPNANYGSFNAENIQTGRNNPRKN